MDCMMQVKTLVSARLNSVRDKDHEQVAPFSLDRNVGSDGFFRVA